MNDDEQDQQTDSIKEISHRQCKWKIEGLKQGQTKYRYYILFQVVSNFCFKFQELGINLALPQIQEDFELKERSSAQWLISIFYIATAAAAIPLGKFADKIGYVYGTQIYCGCTLIFSVMGFFTTKNFIAQLFSMLFIGAFSAGIIAARNTMISKLPGPNDQQKFIGYVMLTNSVSFFIMPMLLGLIIDSIGWPYFYLFAVIACSISIIYLTMFTNPVQVKKSIGKFDIFGSITLTIAVTCLCLFFTIMTNKQYMVAGIFAALSVGFVVLFLFIEKKHTNPILPFYLMKNPVIDIIACNLCYFCASSGVTYLFPQAMKEFEMNASLTGTLTSLGLFINIFVSAFLPMVQRKIVNRFLIYTGCFSTMLIGSLTIVFMNNRIAYIVLYVITSSCLTMISQTLYPMMLMSVPQQYAAQVSAIPTTSRTLGQSLSLCIFSSVLQLTLDGVQGPTHFVFATGQMICYFLILGLAFCIFVLDFTRVGNAKYEIGKRGYQVRFIREIQVQQAGDLVALTDVRI